MQPIYIYTYIYIYIYICVCVCVCVCLGLVRYNFISWKVSFIRSYLTVFQTYGTNKLCTHTHTHTHVYTEGVLHLFACNV